MSLMSKTYLRDGFFGFEASIRAMPFEPRFTQRPMRPFQKSIAAQAEAPGL
ncbi:MAG: hypothetical protein LBR71_04115 [Synergistaceae bacterium]|nr:hypothetical protein [Synergistaceae bacterium]